MDYKKKYKEVLERAKRLLGTSATFDRFAIARIFPELEKSEDERIRKALIENFKFFAGDHLKTSKWGKNGGLLVTDILAWLEKQSKQKFPDKNIVEIWKDMRSEVFAQASGNRHEPNCSDDTTKMFSLNDIDEIIEKMSEQKPTNKVELKDYSSIDPHFGKPIDFKAEHFFASKVYGQIHDMIYNPDNKIELSKFHEGDWIIRNEGIFKITQYEDEYGYELIGTTGYVAHFVSPDYLESNYHLWTIKDAKDGDVLIDRYNNIGIYKEIEDIYWDSYIYLGCDGELRGFSIGGKHEQTDTHPSTKEQRALLFQKMHEDGYEWDAKKKELKKVEE